MSLVSFNPSLPRLASLPITHPKKAEVAQQSLRFAGADDVVFIHGDPRKARKHLEEARYAPQPNLFDRFLRPTASRAGDDDDDEPPRRVRGAGDPRLKMMLKNNIILIQGPVSDAMLNEAIQRTMLLVSAMQKLGKRKPIRFLVNSPGGSVLSMNGILDAMDMAKNTKIKEDGEDEAKPIVVETYCVGYAASAASVIMTNGSVGHRYMSPRAQIMIHQPLGGASGQQTDIEINARFIRQIREDLEEHFIRTTKVKDRGEINKLVERDYWMRAPECLEKGFVDGVVTQFPSMSVDRDTTELLRDEDEGGKK